jgi:hypothetical protein
MKKCEIEQILKDATPEQLAEISDLLVAKLGKSEPPDGLIDMDDPGGVLIDKFDRVTQGWLERDGRIECKDTCKGRLCMRKDLIADPVLDLENLLTPDALLEKPDPAEGTIESMTPDALRDIVADPAVVKKVVPVAKADLEDQLTPDALRDGK